MKFFDPEFIARYLVIMLGHENQCSYDPTQEQLYALIEGVRHMSEDGHCEFTDEELELFVQGESSEREAHFGNTAGYERTVDALSDIFLCHLMGSGVSHAA